MSGSCKNASLFNGLNKPEIFKLFSTIKDISEPIFFFLRMLSKFFLDSSLIDSRETATGSGVRLLLVISTSIKPKDLKIENSSPRLVVYLPKGKPHRIMGG